MNPLSIQLWTLNENTKTDFAGTVKEVASIGYKAVELAGTGNLKPAEAARALKDAGLCVSGMHIGMDLFTGQFDQVIEEAKLFQTDELIVPWVDPKQYATREAALEFGAQLNELGAKVRKAGCRMSYHNHDKEFALIEGRPALEWMLEAATPENVAAQVDLFWVAAAGLDPLRAVQRLGTRVRSVHVKDGKGRKQADIGRGSVDFPSIFAFLEKTGIADWYVVEQEEFSGLRMDSVRVAYSYLKSLGKS